MQDLSFVGVFLAGLLTFASPCVLPLIPIHLSVLAGASVGDLRRGERTSRAIWAATAFSLGLVLVFVVLGLAASAVGRALIEHRALFLQIGGLLVFLFGLKFLGYLRIPLLERDVRPALAKLGQSGGLFGGFVFGAAFGLGWTPCIGPILGSVLTYAATASSSPAIGALYLAVYAAGIVMPLIATAAVAPLALRWHRKLLPHLRRLEVATGVLLAVIGLLLITDRLEAVVPSFGTVAVASAAGVAAEPSASGPAVVSIERSPFAGDGNSCDGASAQTGCAVPDVGAATGSPGAAASGSSSADALGGLLGTGSPRLVEFLSRSCPICQRMEPVLRAAEAGCTGHGVSFIRVDVGTPSGRQAASAFRVRGVPTFVLLDASGVEVARMVGEQPIGVLKQSLEVLAGERCDGFRVLPP